MIKQPFELSESEAAAWQDPFERVLVEFLEQYAAASGIGVWSLALGSFDILIGAFRWLDTPATLELLDAIQRLHRLGQNTPPLIDRRRKAMETLLKAGSLARVPAQGSA